MTPERFVAALREVLPDGHDYPLHEPTFRGREKELLADCVDSTFVSSVGRWVDQLEADLQRVTGAARAVVVVNGTAALQVALTLAGVRPGDLVICPSLTFVATANAIRHAGAEPAFVDVEAESLGMDPDALRAFLRAAPGRIGALVVAHLFGNPARIEELAAIAAEAGIPLVEDAAESLASTVGGRHTGRFGVAGALSFNGNKMVTTGGGGAVLTDDEALGARCKHLTTTAKRPHRWEYWHTDTAWNYRMPNLNAALGVAQLERLPELLAAKAALFRRWERALGGIGLDVLRPRAECVANHWLTAAVLPPGTPIETRDALLDAACDARVFCRPLWVPMHRLPMYAACPRGPMTVTEDLYARVINVPSSAHL